MQSFLNVVILYKDIQCVAHFLGKSNFLENNFFRLSLSWTSY